MTATVRGWTASSVPIALWIAHLTALAALADPACDHEGLIWVSHALTVGLAAACVPFIVVAARLVAASSGRRAGSLDEETETFDDLYFLGWLGVGMGAASVLLIVAEGLMVLGIHPCL